MHWKWKFSRNMNDDKKVRHIPQILDFQRFLCWCPLHFWLPDILNVLRPIHFGENWFPITKEGELFRLHLCCTFRSGRPAKEFKKLSHFCLCRRAVMFHKFFCRAPMNLSVLTGSASECQPTSQHLWTDCLPNEDVLIKMPFFNMQFRAQWGLDYSEVPVLKSKLIMLTSDSTSQNYMQEVRQEGRSRDCVWKFFRKPHINLSSFPLARTVAESCTLLGKLAVQARNAAFSISRRKVPRTRDAL